MPSSSGKDRPGRQGGRALLYTLALLLAMECLARILLVPRTRDVMAIRSARAQVAGTLVKPGGTVVVMGNSLVLHDIVPRDLGQGLSGVGGRQWNVAAVGSEGTKVGEWIHMARRAAYGHRAGPELLVVPYHYIDLDDGVPLDLGRMAQSAVTWRDWPGLWAGELRDWSGRVELAAASASALFAMRERLRLRIMSGLVPRYHAYTTGLRDTRIAVSVRRPGRGAGRGRLRQLAAEARRDGVRLCLVAMPSLEDPAGGPGPDPATLRAEVPGLEVIDLRGELITEPGLWTDWNHLGEEGARRFTPRLAREIARILAETGR